MTTPPPGYPPPGSVPYPPPQQPQEENVWAVLAHLSIFAFGLIGPLVIYLWKKDTSAFTRQHAAEALNFHLTLLIAGIVSLILVLVLIGIFLLIAVAIFGVVMGVIAAVAAGNNQPYRYPMTIHFVS